MNIYTLSKKKIIIYKDRINNTNYEYLLNRIESKGELIKRKRILDLLMEKLKIIEREDRVVWMIWERHHVIN